MATVPDLSHDTVKELILSLAKERVKETNNREYNKAITKAHNALCELIKFM
jgi:hypothetical protein